MNLQDATTKTSSAKEEESSEYCLAAAYGSVPSAADLPKSESRDQLAKGNSPTLFCESSLPTDGNLSNSYTSQYNGIPPSSRCHTFENPTAPFADSAMIVPSAMGLDSSQLKLLLTAERLPPVTKRTLSELDLDRIMRNINLRVDVNFDHGLHFMPADGGRARDRRQCATDYYEALGIEISIYAFYAACDAANGKIDNDQNSSSAVVFEPRLPDMLVTLQDVLGTLVPERDHFCVMENLDVSFLMQQIRKGVLDLVSLSRWLGELLKTHCAPMRDPLVDKMVTEIKDGCAGQDMYQVAEGLKTMFGALEAMKLDVANHQIRAFRIVLVEDTVRFLQNHFLGRMTTNTINAERARRWYSSLPCQNHVAQPSRGQFDSFEPVKALFRGMISLLISHDRPKGFPDTFEFDAARLWRLRADVQDIIRLELCYHIFRELVAKRNRHISIQTEEYLSLREGIWSALDGPNRSATGWCRWQSNTSGVALEIARALSSQEARQAESHGNRNGNGNGNSNDRRSRATNVDESAIQLIGKLLESSFKKQSSRFYHLQARVRLRLETEAFQLAKRYLCMSPLEICEAQLQRATNSQSADLENVAKRLAHIGVLHWKVWAPLLYARDGAPARGPDDTLMHDSNNDSRTSTEA